MKKPYNFKKYIIEFVNDIEDDQFDYEDVYGHFSHVMYRTKKVQMNTIKKYLREMINSNVLKWGNKEKTIYKKI